MTRSSKLFVLAAAGLLATSACSGGSDEGPGNPVAPEDRERLSAELETAFAGVRQQLPERRGSTTVEAVDVNGTDVVYRARVDSEATQDVINTIGGLVRYGLCSDEQIAGWIRRGATITYEFRGTGNSVANMRIARCG